MNKSDVTDVGWQTVGVSIPALLGVIEPLTWSDARVRFVYVVIAAGTALITFTAHLPKSRAEVAGRIFSSMLLCFVFLPLVARWFHSVTGQTGVTAADTPGSLPFDAAVYAAASFGVFGWWFWSTIVGVANNPKLAAKFCSLMFQWKFKEAFQSIFAEVSDTNTNGAGQGQSGNAVTRTPEQVPTKQEQPEVSTGPTKNTT